MDELLRTILGIFPIFWISLLVEDGVRRASIGQLANWGVNGLPANERLRRYLARAVAWPKMEFSGQLPALAQRFSEYVPPSSDRLGFVPHVTVSVFDSDEELSQARQAVSSRLRPVHFTVRGLSYAVLGEDGKWQGIDRLVLGRSAKV